MAVAKKSTSSTDAARWVVIGVLVVVAFFGAYKFASASSGAGRAQSAAEAPAAPAGTAQSAANTAKASDHPGSENRQPTGNDLGHSPCP